MSNMLKTKNIYYLVIITIMIIVGTVYIIIENHYNNKETMFVDVMETQEFTDLDEDKEEIPIIYVQVCGAVNNEGVYGVPAGTRVFEVVELAGGLTEDASVETVNQARIVRDEEKIYFPTIEEIKNGEYSADDEEKSSLININKASKEELMTLPGIGETKASSIIKYRIENNGFDHIEEIMNVDGIKENLFNKIKFLITI